ncbi:hypothetical protein H4219_000444 [Mycoemilia scoparia]|uniref:Uncharacterized protein n=1 Tax=Mycoemilia scoparia TaxID=417184 RepID=A0A9W8A3J3_9FUNG|nr:hypothetical protein H4219_000444 [Mycoemilia scoparia]
MFHFISMLLCILVIASQAIVVSTPSANTFFTTVISDLMQSCKNISSYFSSTYISVVHDVLFQCPKAETAVSNQYLVIFAGLFLFFSASFFAVAIALYNQQQTLFKYIEIVAKAANDNNVSFKQQFNEIKKSLDSLDAKLAKIVASKPVYSSSSVSTDDNEVAFSSSAKVGQPQETSTILQTPVRNKPSMMLSPVSCSSAKVFQPQETSTIPQTPVCNKPSMMLSPVSCSSAKVFQPQEHQTTPQTPCSNKNRASRSGDVLAEFHQGPTNRKTFLPSPSKSNRLQTSLIHNKSTKLYTPPPPPVFSVNKKHVRGVQKSQDEVYQRDALDNSIAYFDVIADTKQVENLVEQNFDLSLEIKFLEESISDATELLSNEGVERLNKSIQQRNIKAARETSNPDLPAYYKRVETIASTEWAEEGSSHYELWLKCREMAELTRVNLELKSKYKNLMGINDDLFKISSTDSNLN